jgi:hypothetical protein
MLPETTTTEIDFWGEQIIITAPLTLKAKNTRSSLLHVQSPPKSFHGHFV